MSATPEILDAAIHRNNGPAEVSATWASQHRDGIRLIDVREPHELTGPLQCVPDVENIPLLELLGQLGRLNPNEPILLICRSGRRSAIASQEMEAVGFKHVASVEGGMMAWQVEVLHNTHIADEEKVANTHNLKEAISTRNGIPEVSAHWVHNNLGRFKLIDVREPGELQAMGAVAQAENIPLGQFMSVAQSFEKDAPLVIMCASGGRSGRAVMALTGAGFGNLASLEGGIFGWRSAGLPAV